jgi:hypothetical protein
MKALTHLRHLAILFVFALAAASASASDGTKKTRKAADKPAIERTVKPQRKEVAPFVDPTLPLTDLVERIRIERAR